MLELYLFSFKNRIVFILGQRGRLLCHGSSFGSELRQCHLSQCKVQSFGFARVKTAEFQFTRTRRGRNADNAEKLIE
jgi:hypothetical protein